MPQNDAVSKAVSSAKGALNKANSTFPSPAKPAATTPVAKAKPNTAASPVLGDSTLGPSLKARQANVDQYIQALPQMHDGGTVDKTGPVVLHKGEEVIPAGRASEYRKVFAQRGKEGKHKWGGVPAHAQSNEDGGNSPAPKGEEKHDEPKAHKGVKNNVNS